MQNDKRTDPDRVSGRGSIDSPAWPSEAVLETSSGSVPSDGRTLRRRLEESGRFDWQDVADLGIQLARQLDAEHSDDEHKRHSITPDTILCTRDGLGYMLGDAAPGDALSTTAAAAEYEAPEVWKTPDLIDARADQFSLGVVLYECLAGNGRRTFRVDFRRMTKPNGGGQPTIEVSHTPQHDLRALVPDAPERLVRVLERATRLTASNRYESCAQLADALGTVLAPTQEAPLQRMRRPGSRWLGAGVAVIVFVLAAVVLYFVQPLIVGSRSRMTMETARQEAERIAATQYASGLWRQAETYQPAAAYDDRARLYQAARETAWRVRIAALAELAKRAVDFEATNEASFMHGTAARTRAEQEWAAQKLDDSVRSLSEAEEDFRAAVAARRTRWASQIRRQLAAEVAKVTENASGMDLASLRAQQTAVERATADPEASADDFRLAENAVADLRHEVAAAMAEAGAVEVARRSADEAVSAADQAGRAAAPWAQTFDHARGPYDRGTAFLLSARDALEQDPSRALALADAAVGRFRAVPAAAQGQVAEQRQAAIAAQHRADKRRARSRAEAIYASAERALGHADATSGATADGLEEQQDAYVLARQKFDEATQSANRAERAEAAAAERAPSSSRELAEPVAEPVVKAVVKPTVQAPVVAVPPPAPPTAAVAAIAPPKPLEPMSANLARQIQHWMSEHCDQVNRDLRGSSDARGRCENLTVHDRRDVAQVRVSYTLILGHRAANGIAWNAPAVREMILDCRGNNCRCIAGPDC